MDLTIVEFQQVDLSDPFFTSLKEDYAAFEAWFAKKSNNAAYIHRKPDGHLDGFLYLKVEDGEVVDVQPTLGAAKRLKVGTFKVEAHGTKLGDRFVKRIFDYAVHERVSEIYVTVFPKHTELIARLARYGFKEAAVKTTADGTELVLIRPLVWSGEDRIMNYPLISTRKSRFFVLGIYPRWHTQLFPDSILRNEATSIIQDLSHTNSIHKVYLAGMRGLDGLNPGDKLVIYRTADGGSAYYTSVATGLCVVEEVRDISTFATEELFQKFCRPFAVFTDAELKALYEKRTYPTLVRFTYNVALSKRPNQKALKELGIDSEYWGFFEISREQFAAVAKWGLVSEGLIVDQA